MRTKNILCVLSLALVSQASSVYADFKLGDYDLGATVGLGLLTTNGAEKTSALFSTFKDLRRPLVLSNANVTAGHEAYYMDFSANQVGLKDQSYSLSGGSYGSFGYELFYDSIIHNYSFGGLSFWNSADVGKSTLEFNSTSLTTSPTSTASWATGIDYTTTAKTFGVNARYGAEGPWFATLGVSQTKRDGLRPTSTNGNNRFNFFEFAEPIDYKTTNFMASGGIRGSDFIASVDGSYSSFANEIESMRIQVPNVASTSERDYFSLAPDNKYWKLGAKGSWYDLPLDSTLSVGASYSKLTDTVSLASSMYNNHSGGVGTLGSAIDLTNKTYANGVATSEFKGDLAYGSANVTLASHPFHDLDTKAYYKFLRKWNKSSEITYDDPTDPSGESPATNHLFQYYKHNVGLDAGYKLPFSTKIGAGFEYLNVNRNRHDAEETKDKIISAKLVNSALDFMTAKLKYEYLNRESEQEAEFAAEAAAATATQSAYLGRFERFFDASNKKQHKVSLGFDFTPVDHLDLALEGSVQSAKFDEGSAIIGRTKELSSDVFADLRYEVSDLFTLSTFGEYGRTKYTSAHWVSTTYYDITASNDYTKSYNWNADVTDKHWGYGLGVDVPMLDKKLNLNLGFAQQRASGDVDFAHNNTGASAITPVNIIAFDDYLKNTLSAKTRYQVTENLGATVGYQYELFKYSDVELDGYKQVTATSNQNYLTGLYNDSNYTAHVGYVMAEYRF
jgi:hypothetical protein